MVATKILTATYVSCAGVWVEGSQRHFHLMILRFQGDKRSQVKYLTPPTHRTFPWQGSKLSCQPSRTGLRRRHLGAMVLHNHAHSYRLAENGSAIPRRRP